MPHTACSNVKTYLVSLNLQLLLAVAAATIQFSSDTLTEVKSPKSSLFGFVEQFLNRLSTNPTKQISERFPGDILTKL